MHAESISPETKRVLDKIDKSEVAKDFYLVGGTALAIQIGHRESIDLDWFSENDFSTTNLKSQLASLGNFKLNNEEDGTIDGELDDVKLSFFFYKFKLIFPLKTFEGLYLADERDIAAMKIDAMSSRGSKKDFIDLYFLLLGKYTLEELMGFFEKKYSDVQYNKIHILKSLIYFEDAENEPMPKMIKDVNWDDVKILLQDKVAGYLK